MIKNNLIQIEVVTILRKIGSQKCLAKAEILENESSSISTLHLRDLGLNAANISSIASCLHQKGENNNHLLQSISFSYNYLLGDSGAMALAKHLPKSIQEIGLVNCGIGDLGGIELLNWMSHSPNLQMICIEQNNFSERLRFEFKKFSARNPQVLVVF